MGDNIPRDDTAEAVLRDMAGLLWRLLDGGYINSDEPNEDEIYSRCEQLRNIAHQDLARARVVLGMDKTA